MLINYRNLHYRLKVFQVAHGSTDCKKSVWIIFQFCFIFTEGEKEGSKQSVAMDYRNLHKHTALQAVH